MEEKTLKPIIWHKQRVHRCCSWEEFCAVWRRGEERRGEERGCATYYSSWQSLFTWSSMSRMSRVTTMLTAFPRLESWNSLATWPPGKQEKTSLKNSWDTRRAHYTRVETRRQVDRRVRLSVNLTRLHFALDFSRFYAGSMLNWSVFCASLKLQSSVVMRTNHVIFACHEGR